MYKEAYSYIYIETHNSMHKETYNQMHKETWNMSFRWGQWDIFDLYPTPVKEVGCKSKMTPDPLWKILTNPTVQEASPAIKNGG